MEYLDSSEAVGRDSEPQRILCCQCGTAIEPNAANTCVACLRTRVDITEGIPKQANIYFCKGCERYLQPPATWVACSLESRELLALCLRRLKGLSRVHMVDAGFVWTEPHSRRIKVKLTVQKEVLSSAILQQVFVVEYVVQHQMCEECHRRNAQDFWRAVVQLRQKVSHKKTFLYLEQLLLKHRAHVSALRIRESRDGMDFYYSQKQDARKLVDFLGTVVPCRTKTSQELVSHDVHSNTYQYKHTFSVEIAPVCKNDIVCLPLKLAHSLGNLHQLAICTRVTTALHLIDPSTLQVADLSSAGFWRTPFRSLSDYRHLKEFYVLQVDPLESSSRPHGSTASLSEKCVLADAWVVLLADLGRSDRHLHCRTHLGHLLKPGDTAWGLDFTKSVLNDSNLERMKPSEIPDVVLVKKSYGNRSKRHRQRNWHLQQLDREVEGGAGEDRAGGGGAEADFTSFLEDLEEDPAYRRSISMFLTPHFVPELSVSSEEGGVSPDVPRVGLEELLQDMTIEDRSPGTKATQEQMATE